MFPANLTAKKFKPNRSLGVACMFFGICLCGMAEAKNYSTILALRILLGCGQGFVQLAMIYCSIWYRRDEMATRTGKENCSFSCDMDKMAWLTRRLPRNLLCLCNFIRCIRRPNRIRCPSRHGFAHRTLNMVVAVPHRRRSGRRYWSRRGDRFATVSRRPAQARERPLAVQSGGD